MAVRKPLEKIDIDQLISKGANVIEDERTDNTKTWKHLDLRIPTKLLLELDKVLEESFGISRTGWILQAIHEKLIRSKV